MPHIMQCDKCGAEGVSVSLHTMPKGWERLDNGNDYCIDCIKTLNIALAKLRIRKDSILALSSLHDSKDIESAHCAADGVLCALLISLGYEDVVKKWEEVPKWYV